MRLRILGRLMVLLVTLLGLLGCRLPSMLPVASTVPSAPPLAAGLAAEQAPVSVPDLEGRVLFASKRGIQADLVEVATKATVSLINTSTNETVATTVTDASGSFSLKFPTGFRPDTNLTYYLEAIKGLGNNMPGNGVARVRTVAKFRQGGWSTVTNNVVNGGIVLNSATTAIALGGALKGVTDFTPFIGAIPGGETDTYVGNATITPADLSSLMGLVQLALSDNEDPMAKIGLSLSGTWVRPSAALVVSAIAPTSGSPGTPVTLSGGDFVSNATVRFNGGATTTAVLASMTTYNATVPVGAISGQTAIQMGNLSILGPIFTVPVTVGSFSPTLGGTGDTVTITGTGFSTTASNNVVTVNGVPASVTLASGTSLSIQIPNATSGPISVSVLGQSAISAATFYYRSALASVNPAVAVTGDLLTLEGSFGPTVTVNFPGGVSSAATVLGANRAQVTVPAGATAGTLTVTTAGMTTNGVPFRRISHGLGMQPFRLDGDQGGFPLHRGYLYSSRRDGASAIIGGYLYVMGGYNGSYQSSVERAPINSDGTLGSFAYVNSLNTARSGHTCTVVGSYLYVIGGYNGGYLNSVERATINADGTIGSFTVLPDSNLFTSRSGHSSAVVGSYLYLVGGFNDSYLYDMERATINTDGTIGDFAPVPGASLVTPRTGHSNLVIGNYLYLVGGSNAGGYLNSVERATINADGTLGAFATVGGVTLGTARYGHTLAILGGYLYVVGGNNAGYLNTLERAPINAGGNLGAFAAVATTLATTRTGHVSAVIGSSLYVLGGYNGSYHSTMERATLLTSAGTLGSFSSAGITLGTPRSGHASAVVRGYLYVVGGYNGGYLNTLERAPINADGTVGGFSSAGVTLGTARSGHTCAVAGNYLYVIGGTNGGYLNTVERATINADGTLGSFSSAGVSLVTARTAHSTTVLGNYLYVIGGNNGADLNGIERASITSGTGALGSFSTQPSMSTPRAGHASVVVGPYLYTVEGFNGSYATASAGVGTISPDESRTGTIAVGPDNPTKTGRYYVDFDLRNVVAGNIITIDMLANPAYDPYLQLINKADGTVIGNYDDGAGGTNSRMTLTVAAGINYVVRCTTYGANVTGAFTLKASHIAFPVERATITSTSGTIGTFASVTGGGLVTARRDFDMAVVGDYLYAFGGYSGGNLSSVERAPINVDGTYGAFAAVGGGSLAAARRLPSCAVIGNSLYVLGGNNGAELGSVERSQLP